MFTARIATGQFTSPRMPVRFIHVIREMTTRRGINKLLLSSRKMRYTSFLQKTRVVLIVSRRIKCIARFATRFLQRHMDGTQMWNARSIRLSLFLIKIPTSLISPGQRGIYQDPFLSVPFNGAWILRARKRRGRIPLTQKREFATKKLQGETRRAFLERGTTWGGQLFSMEQYSLSLSLSRTTTIVLGIPVAL